MTNADEATCSNCGAHIPARQGLAVYGGWPESGEERKFLYAFCAMPCVREFINQHKDP